MKNYKLKSIILILAMIIPQMLTGQHRGDNLAFQGFFHQTEPGVRAMAMGGASMANTGDVSNIFYNPAGLTDINSLTFTVSGNSHTQIWRENQDYRPNRIYWTMAFYLEGLYVPDPANNGIEDHILAQDSNYVVSIPETGLEPYSEEAADWQKQLDKIGLSNIAISYPLNIAGEKIILSAAYKYNQILDFDRNDTYLDPHIGFDGYGFMQRVVSGVDTFAWSQFSRVREGEMTSVLGALSYDFNDQIKLGAGFSVQSGSSNDSQALERVGYFEIESNNVFRFSYDTVNTYLTGTSDFSALRFDIGAVYKFERVNIGLNLKLPYTMTRKWSYNGTFTDSTGTSTSAMSAEDKIDLPLTLGVGVQLNPADWFTFALDYQFTPYSKTKFKYEFEDDTQRNMVDQHVIRFGAEFRTFDFLSLMAGYRSIPATFVPDGAAVKDSGPAANGYTLGASVFLEKFGRFDVAYEYRRFRYYDSYFSNSNYVTENMNIFSLAYTYSL